MEEDRTSSSKIILMAILFANLFNNLTHDISIKTSLFLNKRILVALIAILDSNNYELRPKLECENYYMVLR